MEAGAPLETTVRADGGAESRRLGEGLTRIERRWVRWILALLLLTFGSLLAVLQPPHPQPLHGLTAAERWVHPQEQSPWLALPDLAVLDINAVHAISATHVVVVGEAGLIAHSRNGGLCWQLGRVIESPPPVFAAHFRQIEGSGCAELTQLERLWRRVSSSEPVPTTEFRPETQDLAGLHFPDEDRGWAVGASGALLHTRDGGATWQRQASGTQAGLTAVHFVDEQTGWVVGNTGTILYTRDGGTTWQRQTSGTQAGLTAVHFVDAQTGWVVGNTGTILYTRDGGAAWQAQASGTEERLDAVRFVDARTGWAVGRGGTILHTRNGGAAWQAQASGTAHGLTAVDFVDAQTGQAVGDEGTLLHTRDGGATWRRQASATQATLTGIHFVDAQTGWAVGSWGTILHTRDGGVNWQAQASGSGLGLFDVYFVDTDTGWAVGRSGTILHTRDGGVDWQAQASGSEQGLIAVHFVDAQTGWAVGDKGTILYTRDGGAAWQAQASGTEERLDAVRFVDARTGWAVGRGGAILHTRDGGAAWQAQASGTAHGLTAVDFVDAQTGWAVGDEGTLLHTRDGGATWRRQASATQAILTAVHFVDAQTGWAVGSWGTILRTRDGGVTWQLTRATEQHLYDVHFVDAQTGWAVGSEGTILLTRDGGVAWQTQASGTEQDLAAVHFGDAHTGWVVGVEGAILHTRVGSVAWRARASGSGLPLIAAHFVNVQTGWAVGSGGTILHTRDGGMVWQVQARGTYRDLYDVRFVDEQTGWAVGDAGTILHTRDGGAAWQALSSSTKQDLRDVHFVDADSGWAVGDKGTILFTRDSGAGWHAQASGTERYLAAVDFVDTQTGHAVGDEGTILYTRDGGAAWQAQASGTEQGLLDVHFVDAQIGWAVGRGGTILHTRDGGVVWQAQASGTEQGLAAVHFVDAQTGWVVGDEGTILYTRDGGAAWQAQASGTGTGLLDVHVVDAQTGWAVGLGGTVLRLSPWLDHDGAHRFVPARWYWVLLIAVLGLFVSGWTVRVQSLRLSRLIGGRLLSDRPLERPEQLDPRSPLLAQALELSAFLRNGETLAPVSIAVEGDWGSGKSSLMRLVHGDLDRRGFAPVWFNAWHHERGEHLLASLYYCMREHWYAPGDWSRWGGFGRALAWLQGTLRLLWLRARARPLLAALWVFGTVLVFSYGGPALATLLDYLRLDGTELPPRATTLWLLPTLAFLALASPLAGIVLWQWWMRRKFRAELAHLLSVDGHHGAESKAAARIRFAQALADWSYARDNWRLVLFIDDLDRCSPQTVLEVLELSNFLATTGRVICVVALQSRWVIDCIRLHYRDLFAHGASKAARKGDSMARRYLEKMFTLRVRVRPLADCDLSDLIGQRDTPPESGEAPNEPAPKGWRRWLAALREAWRWTGSQLDEILRFLGTAAEWGWLAALRNGSRWAGSRLDVAWRFLRPEAALPPLILLALLATSAWYGNEIASQFARSAERTRSGAQERVDELRFPQELKDSSVLKALNCLATQAAENANLSLPLCPQAITRTTATGPLPTSAKRYSEPDLPEWTAKRRDYRLRLQHSQPSLAWADIGVRIQAASATLLLLALLVSLTWQGFWSVRGQPQDRAFETDSDTFVSILAERLHELRTQVRTPREWKRLLNHLRLATTSIVPLLCDADPEYRGALERLAGLQQRREQQSPGLGQRLAQAREDQARAHLPHRSFEAGLEQAAMRDVVDVLLAVWTKRTPPSTIPKARVQLIRSNLPDMV